MLRQVSRTFALSIEHLPDMLRQAITLAYLMYRVADYLEDNDEMDADRKADLLQLWARVLDREVAPVILTEQLNGADTSNPDADVAQQAVEVLDSLGQLPEQLQEHIRNAVRETSIGMARWQQRGPRVEDEADLDDYMFEVAGRVGHLLTRIFAWHAQPIRDIEEELMPLSREYGLGLQTVNVIRGLRKDFERGWIFVPQSFCELTGITTKQLFEPANLKKAQAAIDLLADKAERHLINGLVYVQTIPRRYHRLRIACAWPLFFAVRTLAVSRSNPAVLESEVKITRDDVKQIIFDTRLRGWSNAWLDKYYEQLISA